MNTLVPQLLRGMTDGFFLNIGHAEDTSALQSEFQWEGLYVELLTKPLHEVLNDNRAPTLLHYMTINEGFPVVSVLKEFFEKVQSIPGWKRRIIIMRIPRMSGTKEVMDKWYYTFVSSDGNFDYYIHKMWDILV